MKRLLFISQRVNNATSGARVVAERNLAHCRALFGEEGVSLLAVTKRRQGLFSKWSLRLRGYLDGAEPRDLREALDRLKDPAFGYVFIDSSYFGLFAARIRRERPELRIVCFFHDVLVHWWAQSGGPRGLRYQLLAFLYRRSERASCSSSDLRLVMTERDAEMLGRLYGGAPTRVVPLSVDDRGGAPPPTPAPVAQGPSGRPLLLFVGTNYRPNVEGLQWFLEDVMPRLDAELRIVGAGLEEHRGRWEVLGVTVVGRVEDLDAEYRRADAVVLPLFSGSGMKVKTCEALMHGKALFASEEALVGYEIDGVEGLHRCETADAFVEAIGVWFASPKAAPFLPGVRALYEARYSPEATLGGFREAILETA